MGRVAAWAGFSVIGLLLLGVFLFRNRSEQSTRPEVLPSLTAEAPSSLSSKAPLTRWNFDQTLVYRFEVSGDLTVEGPVKTEKGPESAEFSLKGNLAIGPGKDMEELLCQFQNISVTGNSGSAESARKSLEGKTARLSLSDRGEVLSAHGDEQVRVFLSHLEFILPEGDESEWIQEGSDPAGSFLATYRHLGVEVQDGHTFLKLEKRKEYKEDPSSAGSAASLPHYSSTGYFDLNEKRMQRVTVLGTIPEREGLSITGRVSFSFVFDREESEPLTENRDGDARQETGASRKGPQPTRSKISFSDISPHLYSADPKVRARALLQLMHVPGERSRRVILEASKDRDFRIRAAAAQALVTYRSEQEVLTLLLKMLQSDSNPLVRYRVAGALKGSSLQEARDLLALVAKEDQSNFVRKAANEALAYPIGGLDAH